MDELLTTDRLLALAPKFHTLPGGGPHSYGLSECVLQFLAENTSNGTITLETGAGLSTILFALNGCRHTCIVPDQAQIQRITEFCSRRGIGLSTVTFHSDLSQNVLPRLVGEERVDLGLIDGSHSFPVTFIDFFYIALRLKPGGLLIVDNTNIWTGEILRKFLMAESGWTCVEDFPITSVFRKNAEVDLDRSWPDQPYVKRRTYYLLLRGKIRVALRHVRRGEFRQLRKKLLNHILLRNPTLMNSAR